MAKRTRKSVDPKEKIRLLKEDVEKKTALAAKAQAKLKDEENRQLEKAVRELQILCVKLGGDINDAVELMRLMTANEMRLSDEIKRLSGEQLEFMETEDNTAETVTDNEIGTISEKAVNADDK